MSVPTGGFAPGWGANNSGEPGEQRLVSADGRYVVLAVSGPVVPGQKPADWQIVRRDRHLGSTTLISRSTAGAMGNGRSGSPSISADGQVVAFHSYATNLVPGDTNKQSDVFVHDIRTGRTTRASVTSSGAQVTVPGSTTNPTGPPTISADGRFVGFSSRAVGLAPGDAVNSATKAYLHDRALGTTEVVSRTTAGAVVDVLASSTVSVSRDGQVIAFYSGSASVVAGDTNGDPDVFVRTRGPGASGTTVMVPAGQDGSNDHALSSDGRFVAFRSTSQNLVPGDTNGSADLFVRDLQEGTTERVNVASDGTQANADSARPAISADGRYVTFHSAASNLVSGDSNGSWDVFRRDRTGGQTVRVSVADNGGQSPADSKYPSVSADGQHVTFESYARTLTRVATSGYGQVYVRDLAGRWPALHAALGATPTRVIGKKGYRVSTRDIRTGPALAIAWTPTGTGSTVRQVAAVSGNAFTLVSPAKHGSYRVTVHYAGNLLGTRTITVIKPSAKKLPTTVKARNKLTVRTVGLDRGQKVSVTFKLRGAAGGKAVKRVAKTNAKGVVKVASATRPGTYRVSVSSGGTVLRTGTVRVR